jgi:hypothetical protein
VKIGVIVTPKYHYISFGKNLNEMVTKLHKIKSLLMQERMFFKTSFNYGQTSRISSNDIIISTIIQHHKRAKQTNKKRQVMNCNATLRGVRVIFVV